MSESVSDSLTHTHETQTHVCRNGSRSDWVRVSVSSMSESVCEWNTDSLTHTHETRTHACRNETRTDSLTHAYMRNWLTELMRHWLTHSLIYETRTGWIDETQTHVCRNETRTNWVRMSVSSMSESMSGACHTPDNTAKHPQMSHVRPI